MNAAKLDRLIQVLRAPVVDDGFQTGQGPFAPYGCALAASRRDVSDGEKLQSGQLVSDVMARFVVRSSPFTRSILPSDRLHCEGRTFNILGIKQMEQRGAFLEITAIAGGAL